MRPKPPALYEARLVLGLTALLPVLGLPAFALLSWLLAYGSGYDPQVEEALISFEIILPLCAGLAAAHLMTIERDEGFEELRRTYPEPAWRLPLVRTSWALLMTAAALLAGLAAFWLAFGFFPLEDVLKTAVPPAVFMLGLSLLSSHMAGSYWAGAGVVMVYWFLEISTRGQVTGQLFLFAATWPTYVLSYPWNRWLLAGVGLLFLALNAWIFAKRPARNGLRRGALADR